MIDDTGTRITALERIVNNLIARINETNDDVRKQTCRIDALELDDRDDDTRVEDRIAALEREAVRFADLGNIGDICAKHLNARDTCKARAEAADRLLEQVLLWWRAEEELSMSDIVEKIRAHLKGSP